MKIALVLCLALLLMAPFLQARPYRCCRHATFESYQRLSDGTNYCRRTRFLRFVSVNFLPLHSKVWIKSRNHRRPLLFTVREHGKNFDFSRGGFAELYGSGWKKAGVMTIFWKKA